MMKLYETREYQVEVRRGEVGESFYNPLEDVTYKVTEENVGEYVVLRGTVGEMWLAPIKKVLRDYTGDMIFTSEWHNITRKPGGKVCAEVVTEETMVTTCTDHELHPQVGDYLVCSANEDGTPNPEWGYWTINRQVFNNTYSLSREAERNGNMSTDILTFVKNMMEKGHTEEEALLLWEIESSNETEDFEEEPQSHCPYCPNTQCDAIKAGICEECACYTESPRPVTKEFRLGSTVYMAESTYGNPPILYQLEVEGPITIGETTWEVVNAMSRIGKNKTEPFCPFSTVYCDNAHTDKCDGSCPLNPDFEG